MAEPKTEIRFYIPERLYNEIQLFTLDPVYLRPKYGLVSKIGTYLLEAWVAEVKATNNFFPPISFEKESK